MRASVLSIPVLNQEKALQFYTGKLGFVKKLDIPMGGDNRWLTVVAKDDLEGVQILLEPGPLHFEPMKEFQTKLLEARMPWTQFDVDSVDDEYKRLSDLGVEFIVAPKDAGTVKYAILNDTCGNYIQLVETY